VTAETQSPSTAAVDRPTTVWQNTNFVKWLTSDIINRTGSAITAVVLPILVYQRTGSAAQTSTLTALRIVPYLFLGLVAGPYADRNDRRRIILVSNLIQGACIALIPIWAFSGPPPISLIYSAALASGVAFVFADAATFGSIPAVIGRTNLAQAQGLLGTTNSLSELIGPSIGALMVSILGAAPAIWIDTLTFVVGGLIIASLRVPFREASEDLHTTRPSAKAAVEFLRHHAELRVMVTVGFLNSFGVGAIVGLLVVFGVRELDLGKKDWKLGLLYGAIGLGAAMAGALIGKLYRPHHLRRFVPPSYALCAVALGVLSFVRSLPLAIALLGGASFTWTIVFTFGIIHRMLETPDHLRASVNVIGRMVAWGGQPFGAVTGGLLAGSFGVPAAYRMAAVAMAASAVLTFALLPHRDAAAATLRMR
jgi:MFS family permease